jgi:hypothetical protein
VDAGLRRIADGAPVPLLILLILGAALSRPVLAGGTLSRPLASDRMPVAAEFLAPWQWQPGGQRLLPVAIDAHPSGLVCGLEASRRRLFVTDTTGTLPRLAGGNERRPAIGFATHVYARVGLQIFTLDSWNARIGRHDLSGVREADLDLAAAATAAGEDLREAADFCLDSSGQLFVLDALRGRVLHFSREGDWIEALTGSGDISFVEPVAIDADGRGRIHILEARPPALVVLDLEGRLTRLPLTAEEAAPGDRQSIANPVALVVDSWGNAFVADEGGGILAVPASAFPPWWLPYPAEVEISPADLGVSGKQQLMVADPVAGCVWRYRLEYREPAGRPGIDRADPDARVDR